ncbi:lysozyme E-like [Drosophila sulfurigaster albostrigata]|uniref:lysozyme E-like n=1 Tax=Drosophila sulfurigaster albostrigata TaxID=89887 RepID=UPI002D21A939|nr:lysozyme E-like [Drosophila sulfurigaster albostrigata]
MKAFIVLVVLALASSAFGRTMDRCSLAREMSDLGVPRDQLARWTCIADHKSNYRTGVVGPENFDGSHDYGIFQINSFYWCQPANGRFSHNECALSCNALLIDDITNSVRCSQKILGIQGWSAWVGCEGSLPSIDGCF